MNLKHGHLLQLDRAPSHLSPKVCAYRTAKRWGFAGHVSYCKEPRLTLSNVSSRVHSRKMKPQTHVALQAGLGLAAEHGFYYKAPAAAEWEARFGEPDEHAGWKEMTLPILQLYTESTDGSNIEAKDSAMVRGLQV